MRQALNFFISLDASMGYGILLSFCWLCIAILQPNSEKRAENKILSAN